MPLKGWYFAQLEAVQHEMQNDDDMLFLYELTAPRANVPRRIDLVEQFGRSRVYNTSINEMWYASAAIGAALIGTKVVSYIPYQGATIPFDVIRQHAGKMRYKTGGRASLPAVFFLEESSQSPTLGPQHSDWDQDIYYAHMAGIKTVVPSTVHDAKGLMHAAIRDPDPVVYVNAGRLRGQTQDVADEPFEVAIGEAAVRTEGSDLTIVGYGPVMPYIAGAAETLASDGASVEVVDLRTLFPLDRETILASARKTGRVLSVEPGKFTFGVGAEVLATVLEGAAGTIGRRIAYPDAPPPAAPEMFAWMQVTEQRVLDAARIVLEA